MSYPQLRIKGQKWEVRPPSELPEGWFGQCYYDLRRLYIPDEGDTRDELDTCLHELVHAQLPELSERKVRGLSRLLSGYLWSRGWRREP